MDRLGHDRASAVSIATKILRDCRCFNPIIAHLVLFLFWKSTLPSSRFGKDAADQALRFRDFRG
ncbi:hypothetical protein CPT32_21795 [Rhizobium sophoriradicis]|nr:hypothetical protein CPT32_21795 [Rhizobium sophoriradicis]